MFESFHKTLDRELGPAAGGEGGPPGRDSWLRDWPLLLGLVLSAALIAVSTMVSGSDARPSADTAPKGATAAAGAVPGEVVDVGPAEAPDAPEAEPKKARKVKRSRSKAAPAPQASPEPPPASEPDAAAPSSTGTGTGNGGSASPRKSPPRSTGNGGGSSGGGTSGGAKPGRIVNVTGTSAAFTNGPLSYAFSAPTHTPTVGRRWRLSIAAKRSGTPLQGNVKIDILSNGSVVGRVTSGKLKSGKFAHDFDWPERSVGYPLTVKTTIVGGGYQQSFLFNVKIRSAG